LNYDAKDVNKEMKDRDELVMAFDRLDWPILRKFGSETFRTYAIES
jgi:hypothetical protein